MSKKFLILVLVIGLIFIGVGTFFLIKDNKNKQYYAKTSATVVDVDKDTTVVYEEDGVTSETKVDIYVDYEVDGVKYSNVRYQSFNIGVKKGDTITITYDVRNPGEPFSEGTNLFAYITFIVLGSIVTLTTIVRLINFQSVKDVQID